MTAEITYDPMSNAAKSLTGCYRLEGSEWRAFSIAHDPTASAPTHCFTSWASGVSGAEIVVPVGNEINEHLAQRILGEILNVDEWQQVDGPQSTVICNPVPGQCPACGSNEFRIAGPVGRWEGRSQGGTLYGVTCHQCGNSCVGKGRGIPILNIQWRIEPNPWWLDG